MASQIPETVEQLAHRIAVLNGSKVIAYDTLEQLRAQTACPGSLPEVFEKLVHPRTLEDLENYFNRPRGRFAVGIQPHRSERGHVASDEPWCRS